MPRVRFWPCRGGEMPVYWCVPGTGFRRCIGSLPGLKPRLRAGFWRQFSISGVFGVGPGRNARGTFLAVAWGEMPVYWCVPGASFQGCEGWGPGLKPRLQVLSMAWGFAECCGGGRVEGVGVVRICLFLWIGLVVGILQSTRVIPPVDFFDTDNFNRRALGGR